MQLYILIALVALLGTLIVMPFVRRAVRESRVRREATAMMRAQFPSARELPLSRADKRGFTTDRNGWMRPR